MFHFIFISIFRISKFENLGIFNLKKRKNTFYWIIGFPEFTEHTLVIKRDQAIRYHKYSLKKL